MLFKELVKRGLEVKYPLLNPFYRKYQMMKDNSIGIIYMLHRVADFESGKLFPNENMKVTPAFLENIILKYKSQGFDFLSLDEISELFKSNQKRKNPFLSFTLDDGYIDNYENAYPIFKKYNVPFTIYVTTDFPDGRAVLWWYILEDLILKNDSLHLSNGETICCENMEDKNQAFLKIRATILNFSHEDFINKLLDLFRNYEVDLYSYVKKLSMSWMQIEELGNETLCTIGGHSVTHPAFNQLSASALLEEVEMGCEILSGHLKTKIEHFAYPFGTSNEVGEREFELLKRFDFKTVAIAGNGCLSGNMLDAFRLPRVMLGEL